MQIVDFQIKTSVLGPNDSGKRTSPSLISSTDHPRTELAVLMFETNERKSSVHTIPKRDGVVVACRIHSLNIFEAHRVIFCFRIMAQLSCISDACPAHAFCGRFPNLLFFFPLAMSISSCSTPRSLAVCVNVLCDARAQNGPFLTRIVHGVLLGRFHFFDKPHGSDPVIQQ